MRRTWLSRRPSGKRAALYETGAAVWEAFSGMRLRQGGARWRHSSFPRAGMWSMALPLRWRSRGIFPVSNTRERSGKTLPGGYVRFSYMPVLRALFALNHGEPEGYRTATSRRSL